MSPPAFNVLKPFSFLATTSPILERTSPTSSRNWADETLANDAKKEREQYLNKFNHIISTSNNKIYYDY